MEGRRRDAFSFRFATKETQGEHFSGPGLLDSKAGVAPRPFIQARAHTKIYGSRANGIVSLGSPPCLLKSSCCYFFSNVNSILLTTHAATCKPHSTPPSRPNTTTASASDRAVNLLLVLVRGARRRRVVRGRGRGPVLAPAVLGQRQRGAVGARPAPVVDRIGVDLKESSVQWSWLWWCGE